ncbi:MAG: hypothetical protein HOE48_16690, partial [Candidatus Latescibacteria bacterium]|nr:hypothetical protein [Candidatus Latescibacterota bacterium]
MSLSPSQFDALIHRAISSRDQGHFEAALADFNQAIAANDGHAAAFVHRAITYGQVGQLDAAL